jgi:hypothetical protein
VILIFDCCRCPYYASRLYDSAMLGAIKPRVHSRLPLWSDTHPPSARAAGRAVPKALSDNEPFRRNGTTHATPMKRPVDRVVPHNSPRHAAEVHGNLLEAIESLRIAHRISRGFHGRLQSGLDCSRPRGSGPESDRRPAHHPRDILCRYGVSRTEALDPHHETIEFKLIDRDEQSFRITV